jgi:hypothetical protein
MIQMRDKNLNYIKFIQSIEAVVLKMHNRSKDRRTAVVDNPTLVEEFNIILPRKFFEIRGLCIHVHFITNEALRWRLRLDLEEKIKRFDLKKQKELSLLLHSREVCLKFLYETDKYTSHEIFGNILKQGNEALNSLKFRRKVYKVKQPQRRRGYNDKGSLRPTEKWLESFDHSFTTEQNNKEKTLKLHLKTISRLIKYLEGLTL